jgi:hypothetical protein
MDSEENIIRKQDILKYGLQKKDVTSSWQDYPKSLLEAVISRETVNRQVIYRAWQMGLFSTVGEQFKFDLGWMPSARKASTPISIPGGNAHWTNPYPGDISIPWFPSNSSNASTKGHSEGKETLIAAITLQRLRF